MHSLINLSSFIISLTLSAFGDEKKPPMIVKSGSDRVDSIVQRLICLKPAPLPKGSSTHHSVGSQYVRKNIEFKTPEVKDALDDLRKLSPKDYPFLVKHIDNSRYCHSLCAVSALPNGYLLHWTVGTVIQQTLSNELNWIGAYKARTVGDKSWSPPNFAQYVQAKGGNQQWASTVIKMKRTEIDLAFIDWAIAEEKKRGFKEPSDEMSLMERYESKRQEIKKRNDSDGIQSKK